MSQSRPVRQGDETKRQRRSNPRTRFVGAEGGSEVAPSCEVAFLTAYPTIRSICTAIREPRVAVFAVDDRGVAGHVLVRPSETALQTAIIGRHTSADVHLPDDGRLSLRHLALVVHPLSRGGMTYHLLDLRTPLGMTDELARPVEHMAAQGPLLVQVGAYALIMLPIIGPWTWPEDAMAAWRQLPPRSYIEGERSLPRPMPEADATGIQVIRGARFAREGMEESDDIRMGQLRVRSPRGTSSFVLGDKALRGGVLLGRYDRCDNAGLPVLSDHRISRVHVLLLSVGGRIHAIDTASTNGVWHQGSEVRHHALAFGDELEIGSRLAWVQWAATG